LRSRHHAGCRVAVERAADRYTLICDRPLSIAQVGGGGRHVEGVPGSGWNRWPERQAGFEIYGQVGDNHQDAVVAVAEVLNQVRHGFTEGDVAEYAEAFSEALADLMAKHRPGGTSE
jgi:hypothetical protein